MTQNVDQLCIILVHIVQKSLLIRNVIYVEVLDLVIWVENNLGMISEVSGCE